jgi:hypothetical protein
LLVILSWGCTAKRFISERTRGSGEESIESIISEVRRNNLSQENFYIEKATIYFKQDDKTTKILFSVKYIKPDKYLFSLRNPAGIEGARIYVTKDTVLINDRIEKRLLYGKPKDLEKMSGLPYFILNIAFGDLFFCEENEIFKSERRSNQVVLTQQCRGRIWNTVINPEAGKVKSVVFSTGIQGEQIELNYKNFGKKGNHVPGVIELKDMNRNLSADIKIERLQIPWTGEIGFLPGKGYTKEEIK